MKHAPYLYMYTSRYFVVIWTQIINIWQVIQYKADKRHKKEYRKLDAIEKEETRQGDVTVFQDDILVPAVPPTGLSRSQVIDINYELHVSVGADLVSLWVTWRCSASFSVHRRLGRAQVSDPFRKKRLHWHSPHLLEGDAFVSGRHLQSADEKPVQEQARRARANASVPGVADAGGRNGECSWGDMSKCACHDWRTGTRCTALTLLDRLRAEDCWWINSSFSFCYMCKPPFSNFNSSREK